MRLRRQSARPKAQTCLSQHCSPLNSADFLTEMIARHMRAEWCTAIEFQCFEEGTNRAFLATNVSAVQGWLQEHGH
jgi:hypothetical protein